MTFSLKIDYALSPPTLGWLTVNPIFRFCLKEDTDRYKNEPIGVLAVRMLSFIDNKGESTDIGDPC